MRLRLIAFALLLTLALQPAFAAVCMARCSTSNGPVPTMHHGEQAMMTSHHQHHRSVSSHVSASTLSMLSAAACGKNLEAVDPATPVPHVELLPTQNATFAMTNAHASVPLSPERSVTSSIPLHVPLRI